MMGKEEVRRMMEREAVLERIAAENERADNAVAARSLEERKVVALERIAAALDQLNHSGLTTWSGKY
jgi:hypothetical protein